MLLLKEIAVPQVRDSLLSHGNQVEQELWPLPRLMSKSNLPQDSQSWLVMQVQYWIFNSRHSTTTFLQQVVLMRLWKSGDSLKKVYRRNQKISRPIWQDITRKLFIWNGIQLPNSLLHQWVTMENARSGMFKSRHPYVILPVLCIHTALTGTSMDHAFP